MIRRPPRSTLSSSSAASDVYKRQILNIFKFVRPSVRLLYRQTDGRTYTLNSVNTIKTVVNERSYNTFGISLVKTTKWLTHVVVLAKWRHVVVLTKWTVLHMRTNHLVVLTKWFIIFIWVSNFCIKVIHIVFPSSLFISFGAPFLCYSDISVLSQKVKMNVKSFSSHAHILEDHF